jgi:hypothetical protein
MAALSMTVRQKEKDTALNKIVRLTTRPLTQWKPENATHYEAEAEAIKRYARAIKDWALLDKAVDQQIEDQRTFVDWWDVNVGVRESPGRSKSNADRRSIMSLAKAEKLSRIPQQKVSRWRGRLGDIGGYRVILRGPSYRVAMDDKDDKNIRGTAGTGEFERYTPAKYIEIARAVMGTIDLDPASCTVAQKIVKATTFFTVKDDGLSRKWHGNVWLNPPYHRDLAPKFIDKLVIEQQAERITQAILLTNNSTDTDWFVKAQTNCRAICFTKVRIAFLEEDGMTEVSPTQGQAFFYFGANTDRFCDGFCKIGFIATSFVNYL